MFLLHLFDKLALLERQSLGFLSKLADMLLGLLGLLLCLGGVGCPGVGDGGGNGPDKKEQTACLQGVWRLNVAALNQAVKISRFQGEMQLVISDDEIIAVYRDFASIDGGRISSIWNGSSYGTFEPARSGEAIHVEWDSKGVRKDIQSSVVVKDPIVIGLYAPKDYESFRCEEHNQRAVIGGVRFDRLQWPELPCRAKAFNWLEMELHKAGIPPGFPALYRYLMEIAERNKNLSWEEWQALQSDKSAARGHFLSFIQKVYEETYKSAQQGTLDDLLKAFVGERVFQRLSALQMVVEIASLTWDIAAWEGDGSLSDFKAREGYRQQQVYYFLLFQFAKNSPETNAAHPPVELYHRWLELTKRWEAFVEEGKLREYGRSLCGRCPDDPRCGPGQWQPR